jgi:predicted nucleic acid-binding protein
MRLLLDACVLYPTVMRSVLLGAAKHGMFVPLWSDRILEEWARAARKIGPTGEAQARAEIALIGVDWPSASISNFEGLESRLWLPDPDDIHVLAAAVKGSADMIITQNAKDFPKQTLADEGLKRLDADGYLLQLFNENPDEIRAVSEAVNLEANRLSGKTWELRALMKKARLPRLGKALTR